MATIDTKEKQLRTLLDASEAENRALRDTIARLQARIAELEAGVHVKDEDVAPVLPTDEVPKPEDNGEPKLEVDVGVLECAIDTDDKLAMHGDTIGKRSASPTPMPPRASKKPRWVKVEVVIERSPSVRRKPAKDKAKAKAKEASSPPKVKEEDTKVPLDAEQVPIEPRSYHESGSSALPNHDNDDEPAVPEDPRPILADAAAIRTAEPKSEHDTGAPVDIDIDAPEIIDVDMLPDVDVDVPLEIDDDAPRKAETPWQTHETPAPAAPPRKKLKIEVKKGLELDAATVQSRIDAIGRDPYPITLDPAIRNVWVSRAYMSAVWGGNMQASFPTVAPSKLAKHGVREFFYINLQYHPNAPREPGVPGLWFDSAPRTADDATPIRTFVRLRSADWLYVGEYRMFEAPALSQQEWLLQTTQVQKTWAREIMRQGWGWEVCVRVAFRRDRKREPTREEVHATTKKPVVTPEEIHEAYNKGEELGVMAIKCVGYDEAFQRKIAAEFPNWVDPAEAARARRRSEKEKKGKGKGKANKCQNADDGEDKENDGDAATSGRGGGRKKGNGRVSQREAESESEEEIEEEEIEWEEDKDEDEVVEVLPFVSKGTRSRPRKST